MSATSAAKPRRSPGRGPVKKLRRRADGAPVNQLAELFIERPFSRGPFRRTFSAVAWTSAPAPPAAVGSYPGFGTESDAGVAAINFPHFLPARARNAADNRQVMTSPKRGSRIFGVQA